MSLLTTSPVLAHSIYIALRDRQKNPNYLGNLWMGVPFVPLSLKQNVVKRQLEACWKLTRMQACGIQVYSRQRS